MRAPLILSDNPRGLSGESTGSRYEFPHDSAPHCPAPIVDGQWLLLTQTLCSDIKLNILSIGPSRTQRKGRDDNLRFSMTLVVELSTVTPSLSRPLRPPTMYSIKLSTLILHPRQCGGPRVVEDGGESKNTRTVAKFFLNPPQPTHSPCRAGRTSVSEFYHQVLKGQGAQIGSHRMIMPNSGTPVVEPLVRSGSSTEKGPCAFRQGAKSETCTSEMNDGPII